MSPASLVWYIAQYGMLGAGTRVAPPAAAIFGYICLLTCVSCKLFASVKAQAH